MCHRQWALGKVASLLIGLLLVMGSTAAQAAELLMFEARGCPWCKLWHAEVGPGYPKSDEGRRAPLRVMELAAARPEGIVFAAPVTASPTFVLIDGGREVGRITGYPGADFFWAMLAELIGKLDQKSALRVHRYGEHRTQCLIGTSCAPE